MRVQFVERESRPERLVCEAEIHFEEGQLADMRLVGFSLWRSPAGEVFVTFPSRALGVGSERRYFDYPPPAEGDAATVQPVEAWIPDEYPKERAARLGAGA